MVHISFWFMLMTLIFWGGSVHNTKENAESLVVASKKTTLEVNADKAKYMVMSWDQNARQRHSMKSDNSSFERVEEFKYLGATLTNQHSNQEEIKSRMKSGNAFYHLVRNLLSSSLLSKNLKMKVCRTIILPSIFVWVWDLVADIARGKETEGVWEHGVEENIWT